MSDGTPDGKFMITKEEDEIVIELFDESNASIIRHQLTSSDTGCTILIYASHGRVSFHIETMIDNPGTPK